MYKDRQQTQTPFTYRRTLAHRCVRYSFVVLATLACVVALALSTSCSNNASSRPASSGSAPFIPIFHDAAFSADAAQTDGTCSIDFSHVQDGYLGASATADGKLKLQVSNGDLSYNYDLPATGQPIVVPVNMGNGTYEARIMLNTTESRYIELFSASQEVELEDDLAPFVRPNVICNYNQNSACVQLASELCASAATEGDAFDAIYDYICNNIAYDHTKADQLADATGYVPDPDQTLETGQGICFDYASLAAAMLRSQGIPTKILTGYVSPENVYHAWDMIYIDGSWISLHISANPGSWARADITFAANGAGDSIGNGSEYADRYTY